MKTFELTGGTRKALCCQLALLAAVSCSDILGYERSYHLAKSDVGGTNAGTGASNSAGGGEGGDGTKQQGGISGSTIGGTSGAAGTDAVTGGSSAIESTDLHSGTSTGANTYAGAIATSTGNPTTSGGVATSLGAASASGNGGTSTRSSAAGGIDNSMAGRSMSTGGDSSTAGRETTVGGNNPTAGKGSTGGTMSGGSGAASSGGVSGSSSTAADCHSGASSVANPCDDSNACTVDICQGDNTCAHTHISCGAQTVCSAGSCLAARRTFVTFATFTGAMTGGGGVVGADSICQDAANSASLSGTWKAWLTTKSNTVDARLNHSGVPYRLLDGSLVADDWNDLVDGSIDHPINLTERYTVPADPVEVWTGTLYAGTSDGRESCDSWSSSSITATTGIVGNSAVKDSNWTQTYYQSCNRALHLYCVEQ